MDFNSDCQSDLVIETLDPNGKRYLEFIVITNNRLGYVDSFIVPENYSIGNFVYLSSKIVPDLIFFDKTTSEIVLYQN